MHNLYQLSSIIFLTLIKCKESRLIIEDHDCRYPAKSVLGSEQNNGKNITRLTEMLETCLDHPRAQSYLFKHLDGKSKTLTHDQCF